MHGCLEIKAQQYLIYCSLSYFFVVGRFLTFIFTRVKDPDPSTLVGSKSWNNHGSGSETWNNDKLYTNYIQFKVIVEPYFYLNRVVLHFFLNGLFTDGGQGSFVLLLLVDYFLQIRDDNNSTMASKNHRKKLKTLRVPYFWAVEFLGPPV